MKATYKGFETKERSGGFLELPPVGAYIGEIKGVIFHKKDGEKQQRNQIELMIEITEGEFAGRYTEVWRDQKEQWGDKVTYRGSFRLTCPEDGDEDWRRRVFEENLWCVEQCNPGYQWDWEEEKLKGKKIAFSVRERLYTYTDKKTGEEKDGKTTEIAQFETIQDVKDGKVKPLKARDQRKKRDNNASSADEEKGYTPVNDIEVDVPWG